MTKVLSVSTSGRARILSQSKFRELGYIADVAGRVCSCSRCTTVAPRRAPATAASTVPLATAINNASTASCRHLRGNSSRSHAARNVMAPRSAMWRGLRSRHLLARVPVAMTRWLGRPSQGAGTRRPVLSDFVNHRASPPRLVHCVAVNAASTHDQRLIRYGGRLVMKRDCCALRRRRIDVGRRLTIYGSWLLTAALFSAVMAGVTSAHAQVVSGKQPLAVVLCKFKDLPDEPHDVAYYQDMFSEAGAGKKGVFDFWKDVSYGNLDLTGTVVKGWYTADKTGAEYNALDRGRQIDVCASKALPDIDFNKFSGVVVITNFRNLQGPVFGGEGPTTIGGTTYPNLGFMTATIDSDLNISQHETGHTFGLVHSRTVSDNPTQADYGDSYDVMSCAGCYGTSAYSYQGAAGPGLNAVQLANAGWLPAGRVLTFNPSGCTQQTVQMAALNHPEAAGPLEARIPAAVPINKTLTSTTSDYYSIELRSKSGWDSGIPDDTFLVHMRGQDGYSYWVDSAGALTAGTEFVDAARNTYVGVNSIERTPASNGVITLSSCKIKTNLVYSGGTSDTYHEKVFLGANLTVDPSGAPIAGVPVRMTFGSRQCAGTTDRTGHIDCKMQLSDPPGTYTVTASYAGSDAYEPQTATTSYTINKRATSLQYSGASNAINGSATTLKFVLSEDNGSPIRDRKVDLTLGSGASAQTCDAISGIDGDVQCTLPRVLQPAGPTSVQAAFAGDDFYLPATGSATIDVAKGQTVLRYAGPINIANDYPATFRA